MTQEASVSLRDRLSANLDASEAGTLGEPVVDQIHATTEVMPVGETAEQTAQRERDELGRFAAKQGHEDAAPGAQQQATPDTMAAPIEAVQRPTTWKKEYLPMWEKLNTGLPLTPDESRKLAAYNAQREKEFASGVSTYRAEAQNAKSLQDALTPFMPALQQHNLTPEVFIANLGRAHQMLAMGSPEQKLQAFAKLAQDYGVPLAGIPQGEAQINPIVPQLMQQIQELSGQVKNVSTWREQQEQRTLQQEISKFSDAAKYPHFETVRGDMAQLLESGVAKDLDTAYAKAVRLNDDAWTAEQERQSSVQAQAKQATDAAAAAAKAKARATSVKTVTPSGTATNTGPKDRRATLEEKFDSLSGGRI